MESSFLIALALIEVEGRRKMPIGGRSFNEPVDNDFAQLEKVNKIIVELLARVFQLSSKGCLSRAFDDNSFLLVHIPIEVVQKDLPLIKAEWIETGDSEKFLVDLSKISNFVWKFIYSKESGTSIVHL